MEVMRDLGRGWLARGVKSALIAGLMVSCYAVTIFLMSVESAMSQGLSPDAEREMVSISDSLYNPDDFAEAAGSASSVRLANRFYTELNGLPSGTFLSAFDQQVPVANFHGSKDFFAPLGDGEWAAPFEHPDSGSVFQEVRSVQLNKATWDFYGLEVGEGSTFRWADVTYEGPAVPVVLGDSYRGLYDVGDTMTAEFYGRIFTLEVVGLLEPRSNIYYKGDLNFSLDESLVLPYPPALPPSFPDETEQFYSILVFAMLAGDITFDPDTPVSDIRREIELASQRSQFHSYAILGAPSYLTQYTLVRDIVQQNRKLVLGLLAMVSAAGILVAAWTNRRTADERGGWVYALWILGQPRTDVGRVIVSSGLVYALATSLLTIAGLSRLPGHDVRALAGLAGAMALVLLVDLLDELRLARRVSSPQTSRSQA